MCVKYHRDLPDLFGRNFAGRGCIPGRIAQIPTQALLPEGRSRSSIECVRRSRVVVNIAAYYFGWVRIRTHGES